MAAALEDTPITYEELAAIEREFDNVETEIIRQQATLTEPIYTRRARLVSQIPQFWPLVLEQAPPEIDQYITPSDSSLLLSHLTSVSITRPELPHEPRSLTISLSFSENEYFRDAEIRKTFLYRRVPRHSRGEEEKRRRDAGWAGLVSEPVRITWKSKERDLTAGLLDAVCAAHESSAQANPRAQELTKEQRALRKMMEGRAMGGLGFFAWFGYVGKRVSEEENKAALKEEEEATTTAQDESDDEEEEEEGEEEIDLEIFPDGEELALCFADDLWPGAIKYFTQAQEQDALSDADFESDVDIEDVDINDLSDDDDDDDDVNAGEKATAGVPKRPVSKKQRR